MANNATSVSKKLLKVFWIMITAALIFLSIGVFIHRSGISVEPPFGSAWSWGLALLILSVSCGIALPILMRTIFHEQAIKRRKVDFERFTSFQIYLIIVSLSAAFFACLAYLFLVPKFHLYASVLAGLYGVYSSIPSEKKIAGEMKYYGLDKAE